MDKDITIVTGFFDCGRGERKSQNRNNQKYMDYFKFWAGLDNELIIYTSREFVDEVKKIRKDKGREEKTRVIIVEDVYSIIPSILERMKLVDNAGVYAKWRLRDQDISNNAEYNYIMIMKYWMLKDAEEKGFINTTQVAWVDFGWNHGGQVFTKEDEFHFAWKWNFGKGIHLFSRENLETELGFLKLQMMTDGIMGCQFVLEKEKCKLLLDYIIQAEELLLALDCHDDDQMLLTIAYKLHPDDFVIHMSDWYLPLKEYGESKLTVGDNQYIDNRSFIRKFVSRVKSYFVNTHILITRDSELYSIYNRYKDFLEESRKH